MSYCRFCNKQAVLCESHAIPKAFFKNVDPSDTLIAVSANKPFTPRRPIGYYEKLLCRDCERLFNQQWDDYGFSFFNEKKDWVLKHGNRFDYYEVVNFDYSRLKLFVLSVLWRAHWMTVDFYQNVDLGQYENKIKQMLISQAAGTPNVIGIVVICYKEFENERLERISLSPGRYKDDNGINFYQMRLLEFDLRIKIDQRPFPQTHMPLVLQDKEPLIITNAPFNSQLNKIFKVFDLHEALMT